MLSIIGRNINTIICSAGKLLLSYREIITKDIINEIEYEPLSPRKIFPFELR